MPTVVRRIGSFFVAVTLAAIAVIADPYPPYWSGGTGTSIHYAPVAWPADGAFIPYTRLATDIADKRDSDGSNGGTTPQSYVNVSSGCTDQAQPSVYYAYDGTNQVLFFRWRVQAPPHNYATGPNAGSYSASSPWSSALWTVFMDTNGDGYRDFAVHLDGSSGSPAAGIDRLAAIWSNSQSQSLDYVNDASIHLLSHNPAAFVDGPSRTDRILNFHNALTPDANWPNGSSETVWDYGTTRATLLNTGCGEYFIDYQIPLAMLNASAVGGPTVTPNTPMSLFFATANSLQNPIQKDAVVAGDFVADPTRPIPGGDTITPAGGTIQQPTVTSITATGCGSTTLTADVFDTLNLDRTTTVSSVAFYYYADSNADGSANDAGSAWTLAANATAAASPVGRWSATWNSTSLQKGQYLLAVKATDSSGNVTWSQYASQAAVDTFTGGAANNYPNAIGAMTTRMINSCGASGPSITKTVSPSFVAAGGTATFTISISNTLGSVLTVSSVTDSLPAGFAYASTTGTAIGSPTTSPTAGATGAITWSFSPAVSIPASTTRTLIFTATASTAAGTYTNTVSAVTSAGTLSSGATQIGVGSPALTISKTASVSSASEGSAVAYTMTYANDSAVNVTNAVITDVLPAGLDFVSATSGGVYNSGTRTVTWNIGPLPSGSGASSVVVNTTITNPYPAAAMIPVINTASIVSTETSAASASAPVYVNAARAQLQIQVDGNVNIVSAGGQVTYTLTYANTGASAASGVTIADVIPAGWSFVSATGGGSNSSGTVNWTIGALASGASGSVQLVLQSSSPYSGTTPSTDTATVSGTGLTTASDSYQVSIINTASACTTYYFQTATASVGIDGTQKTATTTAVTSSNTGATVNATSNNSSNTVELVRFYQDPAAASQVSLSGNLTSNIYIDRSNGPGVNVTGTVYDYDPSNGNKVSLGAVTTSFNGSSKGLFTFTVPVSGTLQATHRLLWIYTFASANSQSVQLYAEFGGSVTNPLSGGTTAALAQSAFCTSSAASATLDNQVNKLVASAGDTLIYTIRFGNAGGTNMTSAQIVDTLPPGVAFSSATLNGSAITPSISGQQYSFPVRSSDTATSGQVTAGQSGTLVINAAVSSPFTGGSDTLTNGAVLSSTQTGSMSESITTTLQRPSVTITKSADRTLLVPGDAVTYTLTALNSGPGAASNVTIADTLPATAYFTYVANSAKLNGTTISPDPVSSNVLSKNIGSLPAGSTATITFSMTVAASGVPSGTTAVTNTATVADAATSGTRASNSTGLTISTNPNLSLSKSSSPASGPVAPGSTIDYTLTITNTGSGSATGVIVQDLVPSNSSYVSGTLVSGGAAQTDIAGDDNACFDAAGNRAVFTVGTLAAGESRMLTYRVTVDSPLSSGTTTLSSIATATATNAATKQASASITASAAPQLSLVKSAPANVPSPLSTLTAAASSATTIAVANAASIAVGDVIRVGGVNATVTNVTGTSVTLDTAVTAASGAQITPTWEYRLSYANTGNAAASTVIVTDLLPPGLAFVSADNGGLNVGGSVIWNLGAVAAGSSGTLRVRVRPIAGVSFSNTASISSNELGSSTSNTTTTTTGALTVDKATTTPSGSTSGASTTATYVITLQNQSPSAAASSVSVQDDLPAGFTYLSTTSVTGATASSSSAVGATSPVWSGLSIPANSTATITFVAKVANVPPGTYQNYVAVTSSNANVLAFDALSTTADDVTIAATLGTTGIISITPSIVPGATLTITVTDADLNTDPTAADSVQVTVANTRTSEFETVTLTETGVSTGVFSGTLTTHATAAAGTNNAAPLNVANGDTVRASYADALTATGVTAILTADAAVDGGNTAPLAVADSYSVNEDATLTVAAAGALTNDTDAEGNALTALLVSGVSHGTLTLNANGSFTYTPAANYNGPDSFTYKANDGTLDSNTVTVSITVNAVNDAPVAAADSYTVNEGATLTVAAAGLLANDTDVDGSSLTTVLVSDVTHGTLTLNANGSFTYTPGPGYSGSDAFAYKANDGTDDSNVVTVSITINAINHAPVAVTDAYGVNEDATLTVAAAGVLVNDTDPDANSLTATLVSGVSHGTLTLNANGSFTYTPAANYNGPDSFIYKANDGTLDSNVVTVTITVNAVNDPPVVTMTASALAYVPGSGAAIADSGIVVTEIDSATLSSATLAITGNYVSGEDVLTLANQNGISGSFNGGTGVLTLTGSASLINYQSALRSVTYTNTATSPSTATRTLTLVVNDGSLDSNAATRSITVSSPTTPTLNQPADLVVDEDSGPATLPLTGIGAGASGGAISIVAQPADAALFSNFGVLYSDPAASGTIQFTPAPDAFGATDVTITATAGGSGSGRTVTRTVRITINPVNDRPTLAVIADRQVSAGVPAQVALTGIGTGAANETQPLTVTAVSSNPAVLPNPTVTYTSPSASGTLSFTASAPGTAIITVTVDDGQARNATATRTFTVTAAARVNTPPTISPIADISAIEGSPLPSVAFTVGDGESAPGDLVVSVRALNAALIPASSLVLSGAGASRTLALSNAAYKIGAAVIAVTVSDGELSTTASFTATVRPQWDYYLPDGWALPGVATDVRATNPHAADASVRLMFLKPEGAPQTRMFDIAANSRWSARLFEMAPGGTGEVSTFIRSVNNLPLLVERTMTWDADARAGSAETALESTNLRWYFADGGQGAMRTNLIIANPNDTDVNLSVTFMLEGGSALVKTYTVGALARRTITFDDVPLLAGRNFGMVVDASAPIAAERSIYIDQPRRGQAGTTAAGVPFPSTQWYFAEGSNWKIFQTFVLLLNPGSAAAHVRIDYYTMGGLHFSSTHEVAAQSRLTVDTLNAAPRLDGQHFWMSVTSDQPIASDRSMFWDRGAEGLSEGHSSHGILQPSRHWSSGDARVGGAQQYSTFMLIGNPTAETATISVTIKRDHGADITSTRQLAPYGRDTINVNAAVPALSNESFWIVLDSDVPILAERSQYWGPEGTRGSWTGGTNVLALPVVDVNHNGCTYDVGPASFEVPAQGGSVTVNVGGTSRCTFTATPGASWLNIVSGESGSGVASVVIRARPNVTGAPRTGLVTIAGQPVTIAQLSSPALLTGNPIMALDDPLNGAIVGSQFRVAGWAADLAAMDDTPGVSTVHVWAYPNPGSGTVPIFLGAATYGLDRPDVQAAFGERTRNSGFTLTARGLSAGNYQVVAFAYSTVTNSFNQVRVAIVTVVPDARVIIDAPAAGRLTLPVRLAGWAADLSATDDTGIDAVHVWAYPADGSAPQFLGAANYGESRPDVAAAFQNPALTPSGYSLTLDGLAAGRYQLVVFAHRIGAIEFDAVKTLDLEIIGR